MTQITATYISNNGYDALVIVDPTNGNRMHTIDGAPAFLAAQAVGSAQNLANWSGEPIDCAPEDCGEVVFRNDGETMTIINAERFASRRDFFGVI